MLKILVNFTTPCTTTTTTNIIYGIFVLRWKSVSTVQECLIGYCETIYVSK
jgi:hypothetical protein